MKIVDLRSDVIPVNRRGNWVFVRLFTDEGLVGLGEASHSGNDVRCVAQLREMGDRLRSHDPRRIREHWDVWGSRAAAADRVYQTALSAVEQALWDILGQSAGLSLAQLLGGPLRDRIPLYANVNRGTDDRSLENFARRAREAVAEGFSAVKIAPFDEVHVARDPENACSHAQVGLERIAAVREAIGSQVRLMIDCHCRFDLPTARWIAPRLAAFGVTWFEDPVPRHPLSLLGKLKQQVALPLVGGESLFGCSAFYELITTSAPDYVMPDVKQCGGFNEALKVAAIAQAAGIPISPHNPAGPVATMVSVHLCSLVPNFWRLEYQWGEVPWRSELTSPAERIIDGCIEVPTRPGLGIQLNEGLIAEKALSTAPR